MIHTTNLNLHKFKRNISELMVFFHENIKFRYTKISIFIYRRENNLIARNIKLDYMIALAYGENQNCHIVSYYK